LGVLPQILDHYNSQVRFVWRDLPVITAQSPKAAEAGQCANAQGKFWEYHDLLYARAPALSISDLKSYAAELGLDTATFNQCLDSGQFQAKVAQNEQDAHNHGLGNPPAFLVNDKLIIGPQPFTTFQSFIDPFLK
jgi:protein-disulfide isomerase